jgi:hypothetical protein
MIDAVPEEQLRAIIGRTKVNPNLRPVLLGATAGAMLAALTSTAHGTQGVGADEIIISTGIRTVVPDDAAENVTLPEGTGLIEGVVYDQNRAPVSGALVKIAGTEYYTTTGSDGRFRITAIPVGKYVIEASRVGFSSATRTDVEVTNGGITTAAFQLQSMPATGIRPDRP